MLRVVVLGAAAGGGVPQWNCGCPVCRAARNEHPELQSTQASIAISADGEHWFLINASPDLRQQLIATPQLHPKAGQLRHSPIAGVILTNGEVDAVAGLLSMREGSPFTIYAHRKGACDPGGQQHLQRAEREERAAPADRGRPGVRAGVARRLAVRHRDPAVRCSRQGRLVSGRQGSSRPATTGRATRSGFGSRDKASGKYFYFLAACAGVTDDLKSRLAGAPLVFFDGTVWRDDELIVAGLGNKTGQGMGHIAMSGDSGAIDSLAGLDIGRKIFLHINNSNPALLRDSAERKTAERAGWQIPADGTEIML